jgi:hypothetical protein
MGISSAEVDHHTTEEAFESAVTSIQRKIRTWLYRRHEAAKKLQAATRAWLARKNLKRKMNESATLIQSLVRNSCFAIFTLICNHVYLVVCLCCSGTLACYSTSFSTTQIRRVVGAKTIS